MNFLGLCFNVSIDRYVKPPQCLQPISRYTFSLEYPRNFTDVHNLPQFPHGVVIVDIPCHPSWNFPIASFSLSIIFIIIPTTHQKVLLLILLSIFQVLLLQRPLHCLILFSFCCVIISRKCEDVPTTLNDGKMKK